MYVYLSLLKRKLALRQRHGIKILIGWLLLMMTLHVIAMINIEGMSLTDAIWVTTVTATTVGYGDVSAKTDAGRMATIIIMFGGTIFILANLAAGISDYQANKRRQKLNGTWDWTVNKHLLVISTTATEPKAYLEAMFQQFRRSDDFKDNDYLVMTHAFDADGEPESLMKLGVMWVRGDGDSDAEMEIGRVNQAAVIAVLGDNRVPKADALVYDVVSRIRATGYKGRIIAECEDDRNRKRLVDQYGAEVLRPTRGYPEMLVRAVVAQGSQAIVEEIITCGGIECETTVLETERQLNWPAFASSLIRAGVGTPIGCVIDGKTIVAPNGHLQGVSAVMTLLHNNSPTTHDTVRTIARSSQ